MILIGVIFLSMVYLFVAQSRIARAGFAAHALAAFLTNGDSERDALRKLRDTVESPAMAHALDDACEELQHGARLSEALAQVDLPASFLRGLAAIEDAGRVPQWLQAQADRLKWRTQLNCRVTLMLIYPLVCACILTQILLFCVTYVTPTFVSLFEGMNWSLSEPTAALLILTRPLRLSTNQLHNVGIVCCSVCIILCSLFVFRNRRHPQVSRRKRDTRLLRLIPGFAALQDQMICEETASTIGAMLEAGLPLSQALRIAATMTQSHAWDQSLGVAAMDVERGTSLATALAAQRCVPASFLWFCTLGEQSEDVSTVMKQAADWYADHVDRSLYAFLKRSQIAVTWLLSVLCGFVAYGIFAPIAQLSEMMGQ